ncbi:lactonase family protein [Leifsonia sp. F6_8S_P_1B]|uniref:Lactonase family protein n=1 Tax=Leifsonia williamsii TaxID=3035919 RepID=A0ABT8K8X8_9MICO|nr:lactonase family protein [Leifsonia williamsii]MDN4613617.1 lactonase family protein [Leifsonia williamsii]
MAHDLLIGTYTQRLPHVDGHAEGVVAARFDGDRIDDATVAARVTNPSWVAAAPDGRAVYAVEETGPDGRVHAFARDDGGALTPLGSVSSGGADPAHLLVHPFGRFLLAGTYSGGSVSVWRLNADGSIGERTAFVQHEGRGPDDARQEGPHVHQLSVDPVTGDVVVVDLGLGQVRWYALSEEGALTLREDATVALGAAGPRHLVFHPDGRHALVVGELDDVLHVLRREGDRFTLVGGASTRAAVAAGEALPTGENTSAAVRLTEDGRTVLVSNRGDDTIAVFAFEASTSGLVMEAVVPAHGRTPRDLVLSPEGDRLLVACQDSDEVTVFAFDAGTRELRFLTSSEIPTPVCLLFV